MFMIGGATSGKMPQSCRKQSGTLYSQLPDVDKDEAIVTVMCAHCGRHWPFRPGSGKRRGFCTRCYGYTCGNPRCDNCIPLEQNLELMEDGYLWHEIPFISLPVSVSVPADPPRGKILLG
jgi:hypothetical protein